MTRGTLLMLLVWFVGAMLAVISYALDWLDMPMVPLIVLIAVPLGVEIRSIAMRQGR